MKEQKEVISMKKLVSTTTYARTLSVFNAAISMKLVDGFIASSIIAGMFSISKEDALDDLMEVTK